MGAGGSKEDSSSRHVFSSGAPVQFSQELVDSLQASSETNSSRAKTLDLHIANRVAAELEKIQNRESDALAAARARLSSDKEPSDDKEKKAGPVKTLLFDLPTPPNPFSSEPSAEEKARQSQSSKKVLEDIEKLKSSLGQRKTVKEIPKEVEKARDDLVGCLRVNDRKPLDCWKEVEVFKGKVRELEEKFLGEVL